MIKVLRIDYVLTLAAAGLLAAAFELGWLPSGFVEATPETLYTANLFSIVTALGGTYLALRLMAFGKVKRMVAESEKAYCKFLALRQLIIGVAIYANLFLYYALLSADNAAMYCLLITLVAHCFCWPAAQALSDK